MTDDKKKTAGLDSEPRANRGDDSMEYMNEAMKAVRYGNWMVRTDRNGVSAHSDANGFTWRKRGVWTVAPDWSEKRQCGEGLHGQAREAGGFKTEGKRVVFCKTKGKRIIINNSKIKVQKAMILLINILPAGLKFDKDLNLSHTQIKELPEGLSVGGSLYLQGTQIKKKDIPEHLKSKVIY